jgi:hypothetical protein
VIWKAILIGQLIVNVPAVFIMTAAAFLGVFVVPWEFALLSGGLLAWIWWSFSVVRWRNWAIRKGNDPARLEKLAVRTGLTWPRGSRFEKPEFRSKN